MSSGSVWAAVLCEQRFWLKDQHQCGPVSAGGSEMRPQLQKTLLVPLSSSGRSDFNIQHGETRSSCSQEEALRPAWVKEAVSGGSEGGGGVGGGGAGVLLRSSPLYSVFITAESWRESEPGGVSHQHRVLKEGRRLQRPRGTFSFLASARGPRSSSPAPRSVGEHRECLKEQFTRNQSSAIKNFYISHIVKKKKENLLWHFLNDCFTKQQRKSLLPKVTSYLSSVPKKCLLFVPS